MPSPVAIGLIAVGIVAVGAADVALVAHRSGSSSTSVAKPAGSPVPHLSVSVEPASPSASASASMSPSPSPAPSPAASSVPSLAPVTGVLHLTDPATRAAGCGRGSGPYGDLGAGAPVLVVLRGGMAVKEGGLVAGVPVDATTCAFSFRLAALPGGLASYTLKFGTSTARQPIVVSAQSLQDSGNRLTVRLRTVSTPHLALTP